MKLLTLNTHSWLEEQAEEKLQQLASVILAADYDVITLQEVNQLIGGEKATLNCWYCPNNDTTEILSDNFALALVEILQEQGQFYYWTWAMSHIGYGKYEEGLALLSKQPLETASMDQVSHCSDLTDARRRILLSATTKVGDQTYTLASAHYSWWENQAFQIEWQQSEKFLKQKVHPILLAGDFNQVASTPGHQLVLSSSLQLKDSFLEAKKTSGEASIAGPIAGWDHSHDSLRIDYVFVDPSLTVAQYTVRFDGNREPLVSDHFGVEVELF